MQKTHWRDRISVTLNIGHDNNALAILPPLSRATAYAQQLRELLQTQSGINIAANTNLLMAHEPFEEQVEALASFNAGKYPFPEDTDVITFDVTMERGVSMTHFDYLIHALALRLKQRKIIWTTQDVADDGSVSDLCGRLSGPAVGPWAPFDFAYFISYRGVHHYLDAVAVRFEDEARNHVPSCG